MKSLKTVTRAQRTGVFGPIGASLLAIALWAQVSGAEAQLTVAVGDASGAPGGAASVTMTMTGSAGNVATVGFDVVFDVNVLSIQTTNCVIAPRLAATHTLSPFLPQPGRLRLGIFDLVPPLDTFPDGDLATCTFQVAAGAPLAATQLTMQNLEVSDNSVPPVVLASTPANGAITVEEVTPTPTTTPAGPTNTPTNTRTPTVVSQPTNTPTPSNTVPPEPSNTPTRTATRTNTPTGGGTPTPIPFIGGGGGGCTIAAPGSPDVSPLAWLIVPAALLLWRRRDRD